MHLSGRITEIYPALTITNTEAVFDQKGAIVAWKFKEIFSEEMISNLENTSPTCSLGKIVNNVRGLHTGVTFGSLVERGGSGNIHQQEHTSKAGKKFLNSNKLIMKQLSAIMTQVTPFQAMAAEYIPNKFRQLKKFTTAFWNRTPISIYQNT